ncbi:hypothetical protein [Burkholderia sp. IMCC1007]|uniref:hypothetical protein n=1 Tax=Burkholderia sp. IMCC1007 TaxID=3004104 RepID=UPI0022B587F9|nr:hypothetical protein [Burkholderia sp. IMCC1007]
MDRRPRRRRDGAHEQAPEQAHDPAAPPGRTATTPGHAPGGGELDAIPDSDARKVVPDDPRETEARDPTGKPWPERHDAPDDSGNRPRPL